MRWQSKACLSFMPGPSLFNTHEGLSTLCAYHRIFRILRTALDTVDQADTLFLVMTDADMNIISSSQRGNAPHAVAHFCNA